MCILSCGASLAQIVLFVFNFLLSMVSLAVTGLGVFLQLEVNKMGDADLGYVSDAPVTVVVVGGVFSAVFFCGCCGAVCKNRCLLIVYSVITIALATATLVFTVLIFRGTDELKEGAEDALTNTLSNPHNKEILGVIEAALGCCGTTGPEYYVSSVPLTCCPATLQSLQGLQQDLQVDGGNITSIATVTSGGSIGLSCPISEAYRQGCVAIVIEFLSQIFKITGRVLIWIIVIEYVAALLAIFLSCYIGK